MVYLGLYLDDERQLPNGSIVWIDKSQKDYIRWHLVRNVPDAIKFLEEMGTDIRFMSLDHDLGDVEHVPEETGETFLRYMEDNIHLLNPDLTIQVHSANPVGKTKMCMIVDKILRLLHD